MSLSLLEKISGELPQGGCRGRRRRASYCVIRQGKRTRRNRYERLREVRFWVKGYLREIEEAREGGYSWRQIMNASLKIWKEAGIFSNVYPYKDSSLVRRCYESLKKSGSKVEDVSNPLIEIQTHVLIRRGIIN